ncbi:MULTISPECIES: 50S ribosomal protein L10 [Roseivirga]|jgi:large subunit ribosomal protein L10|uniref:Large ribosomal subunit protein uL10 n=1 Tax=Roseivirga spongicola TaxID=333140 RepID=A0A150X957_9BACT|nr:MULTISPECIES: 50S ribosomal protein L10 [Roseivirga]PWL27490.1 MAG: 50S ribosomal protein L10 [Roseivirga sp. XM-24bin3]KYG75258.1 50S ribosomal protein L10 [Roseivirga spongicola]MBO6494875.1 50S ribosomal protein L10 [Roseivirga sp.]MBO6661957.1 50S ribosomal protein L10 [Roseivirga sp.]MBO6760511.1 50S ribosomal protein L10 [Roseivirga sp.]
MTREEKAVVIGELVEKFSANMNFYITDASGMSVAQTNSLRRLCFDKGIEYKVVKNTLIAKALEQMDSDYTPFDEKVLKGFSGVMFSGEDANAPAKLIKEFRKKSGGQSPVLKGASIDTDLFIGEENLDMLSQLKSKAELIGEVITILQSPAKNVISGLQGAGGKLAGILKTLSEREN